MKVYKKKILLVILGLVVLGLIVFAIVLKIPLYILMMISYPNQLPNKRIIYSKETTDPITDDLIERQYLVYDFKTKKKFLLFEITPENQYKHGISPTSFSPVGNAIISLEGSARLDVGQGYKSLVIYNNYLEKPRVIVSVSDNQALVDTTVFSPKGDKIAFTVVTEPDTSDTEELTYQVYIYDLALRKVQVIKEERGSFLKQSILAPIAWVDGGRKLLLGDIYGSEGAALRCCLDNLFLINSDGTNLREIDAKNREMTVSPAGNLITSADGKDRKISGPGFKFRFDRTVLTVYNFDTDRIYLIANDPGSVYRVNRWSPNGREILYTRYIPNDGETPETYKVEEEQYKYDITEHTSLKVASVYSQVAEWKREELGVNWKLDRGKYNEAKLLVEGEVIDSGDLSVYYPWPN